MTTIRATLRRLISLGLAALLLLAATAARADKSQWPQFWRGHAAAEDAQLLDEAYAAWSEQKADKKPDPNLLRKAVQRLESLLNQVPADIPNERAIAAGRAWMFAGELHAKLEGLQACLAAEQRGVALLERTLPNPGDELANVLRSYGNTYRLLGQDKQAIEVYERARAVGDAARAGPSASTARLLLELGKLYEKAGRTGDALKAFEQSLAEGDAVYGPEDLRQFEALVKVAMGYRAAGRHEESLQPFERVLSILTKSLGSDHATTMSIAETLAEQYYAVARYEEALPLVQRALVVSEKAQGSEHPRTAAILNILGVLHLEMGLYEHALPLMQRALAISEKAEGPEHPSTGVLLNRLGQLYHAKGRYEQALSLYQRSLAISEKAVGPEHPNTGTHLNNLGLLHRDMGRYEQALPLYLRALAISEKAEGPEHPSTGIRLNNLGMLYLQMGRYEQALPLVQRALAISEKVRGAEHPETGEKLNNLGRLYRDMGRYEQALLQMQRALAIGEKAQGPEHPAIGIYLNNVGQLYQDMGRYEQALPLLQRALAISEKAVGPEHPKTGIYLNNLGVVYRAIGRYEQALPMMQRALAISENAEGLEHPNTGVRLNELGWLYGSMGRYEQALPLLQRSQLILASHEHSPVLSAQSAGDLAQLYITLKQPDLAIFFGKQSVNGFQSLRAGMSGLDKELQQGFLKRYESYYNQLAGWLVDAGRLAEAQQVTAMLKERELYDMVRRDPASDPKRSSVAFDGVERPRLEQMQSMSTRHGALASELQTLRRKASAEALSPEETSRVAALEAQLKASRDEFERYLSELQKTFASLKEEQRREVEELNIARSRSLRGTLQSLGHGAAMLHYIALDDELKIILTTPDIQRGYTVKVGRAELNRSIDALRRGIDRRGDVLALSRKLHGWLIEPVQPELEAARSQTLMLALSGAMRYLPMGALHDGHKWLAERYAVTLYTEAARDKIALARGGAWQVQAFGVTRPFEGFKPLAAVAQEVQGIVGPQGLPGQARLDEQFTAQSFSAAVQQRPPVLHLASHFVFKPGSELDSFLLLGDGSRLTLADIKGYDFHQDLLTLSACETALGGGLNENGREIEGFGALAQDQGAKAVLATLWPVADASTAEFMQRFYRHSGGSDRLTKAQALQRAQAAFIADGAAARDPATDTRGGRNANAQPTAEPQEQHPGRSHPYYWAPFVLMGNWL